MRLAVCCLCVCAIGLLFGPRPAAAQADVRFPPPSLRIGEFRMDARVKLHFDVGVLASDSLKPGVRLRTRSTPSACSIGRRSRTIRTSACPSCDKKNSPEGRSSGSA